LFAIIGCFFGGFIAFGVFAGIITSQEDMRDAAPFFILMGFVTYIICFVCCITRINNKYKNKLIQRSTNIQRVLDGWNAAN
jgi:hypothetical protein